jgi:imidazolonepropionase-like amidohydrolase
VFELESDEILALVNGTLIDGTGADPLPDAALVIQEGRVIAVGPRAEINVPDDAKIIDVQGSTILPGFINAHVHLGFDEEKLEAWAQGGVTTVRDLGAFRSPDLFSRRDALLMDNGYARLVAAGPIVTVPEGYPMAPWGVKGLPVTSPEDAASKINGLLDDGADVIKIAVESGYIFSEKIPVLSAEEAAAIVSVAHERGTVVSAHVTASQDLGRALDAGVDDIAHMITNPLYDGLIEHMLENDVYWVPTLELWKNVGYGDRRAIVNLAKFVEAGGKVALGTDYAGYNAEFDLGMPITEIELMQKAGMTPMQIIVAGTKNGAHVCNLDHELGTLEAGKIADVLVVDGDPLEDIHALTNIRMVLHNGVVIRDERSWD